MLSAAIRTSDERDPRSRRAASMAVDAAPVLVVGRDEGGVFEPGTILGDEGFQVTTAASIAEAVEALRSEDFALVVVDVVEPQGHCGEIVRRVRQLTDAPIITLVPTEDAMEVTCLDMGADDCMLKPLSANELLIRARLRIVGSPGRPRVLRFDGLTVALAAREVRAGDEVLALTPREYELLAFLASSPRVAYTRDALLERVWGSSWEWQDPRTVTEHIYRLRRKLDVTGREWIVTVPGAGYRFDPEAPPARS